MSEEDSIENEAAQKDKSEIPKIFGFIIGFAGIYFLIISLFSLLTLLILQGISNDTGAMSPESIYTMALTITSILISTTAVLVGFKLVKYRDSGRKIFNVYTLAVIVFYSLNYLYKKNIIEKSFANIPPELAASVKDGELASLLVLFILPAILVVVAIILNLKHVKNSLSR